MVYRARLAVPVFSLIFLLGAPGVQAVAATPGQVEESIKRAKEFLYRQQHDGNWESTPKPLNEGDGDVNGRQWGGPTALVTYALLASGETRNDPRIAKAVDFLKGVDMKGIYAVGLRCQVWLLLGDDKTLKPYMRRDLETLLGGMYTKGPYAGFFSYANDKGPHPENYYDHSVSQYGVLGLWALEQAGIEVPPNIWKMIELAWRGTEYEEGGWAYRLRASIKHPEEANITAPMTAAGVASLFISLDYLQPDAGNCKINLTSVNIERGLNWIDKHSTESIEQNSLYGLYGIERIGVASGRKYFGTANWYDRGADVLIKLQNPEGAWGGNPDTSFGLLFMVRGRAPVTLNKLQYENAMSDGHLTEGAWNERPRDAANFARWMGRNLERDLNWQIVNLKGSTDDLHDAPILYITGSDTLRLNEAEEAKLRLFCEQGGMILANADCAKQPFADSILTLGRKLFPQYEFRELEPTHVIYTNQQFPSVNWKKKPSVLGLSNGVRELMLLVPESDLSRAWQMRSEKTNEIAYQLGADIFVYSIDKKSLRFKGESTIIHTDPAIVADQTIKVARLQVGENWDPEPGGWRRMAALMHNRFKLDVKVEQIDPEQDKLAGFKIAHLTGTTKFSLSPEARAKIAEFVLHGGTLVVDAAGGSRAFADSAETELKEIFSAEAESLNNPLPPFSGIYTLPEAPMESVTYRNYIRRTLGGDTKSPHIRGIDRGGRMVVLFSREDISAGMVGEPVDGVAGYSPETATALMRNIILYSARR